jgi:WD40 repeat protein
MGRPRTLNLLSFTQTLPPPLICRAPGNGYTGPQEVYCESVAYSPDGAPGGGRIVCGSGDQTVRVWDAETGQELTRLTGHTGLEHQSTPIVEEENNATLC